MNYRAGSTSLMKSLCIKSGENKCSETLRLMGYFTNKSCKKDGDRPLEILYIITNSIFSKLTFIYMIVTGKSSSRFRLNYCSGSIPLLPISYATLASSSRVSQ